MNGFQTVERKKLNGFVPYKPALNVQQQESRREVGYVATVGSAPNRIRLNANITDVLRAEYIELFVNDEEKKLMLQSTTRNNPNAIKLLKNSARKDRGKVISLNYVKNAFSDFPNLDCKNFNYKYLVERDYDEELPTMIIDFSKPVQIIAKTHR